MEALSRLKRVVLAASLISLVGAGCGGDDDDVKTGTDGGLDGGVDGSVHDGSVGDGGTSGDGGVSAATTAAADLRTNLNLKLSEHIVFAAKATGAALAGRTQESAAYAALLNTNGNDLGEMIGAAFGAPAKTRFNEIWSAHNGYFVQYTMGVATNDTGMKDTAVTNLTTQYVPDFVGFLAPATGLPESALTPLISMHVAQTKAIVDAQGAAQTSGDYTAVYTAIRTAFKHMAMIGNPLAVAIAGRVPATFPGDASSKAAAFRSEVNVALQEHFYLATSATGAALAGKSADAAAAIVALNANGTELGTVITSLFGADAGRSFNSVWSAHNGFFVSYVTGVATNDASQRETALANLNTMYVPPFSQLVSTATGLPLSAVTALTQAHVDHTKATIDLQAVKPQTAPSATASAASDRAGAQHMQMIGDPLAESIVVRLPANF